MTWETAKQIVDFLMSLSLSEDEVIFDFIGGEPLLEIGLIERISDYLVDRMNELKHPWLDNYSFRFTTNGINYSSRQVQKYIEKYKDRLSVQISIDGTKKKHDLNRIFADGSGSYDKLIPNVKKWLNQFENRSSAFMVISHDDLPYLSESVIHLITLGIRNIVLSLVVEDVWKPTDGALFEKELSIVADYILENKLWNSVNISSFDKEIGVKEKESHIHPCGNPMYVFDATGNIYTCVRFVKFSLRSKPTRIIGSINSGIDYNKVRPLLAFDIESSYPEECVSIR